MRYQLEYSKVNKNVLFFPKRGRVRGFLIDLGRGWFYQYPLCCAIRFAIDQSRKDGQTVPITEGSAFKRGFRKNPKLSDPDSVYVPCGIFHHKHGTLK